MTSNFMQPITNDKIERIKAQKRFVSFSWPVSYYPVIYNRDTTLLSQMYLYVIVNSTNGIYHHYIIILYGGGYGAALYKLDSNSDTVDTGLSTYRKSSSIYGIRSATNIEYATCLLMYGDITKVGFAQK